MECGWEPGKRDLGGLGLADFAAFGLQLIFAFLVINSIFCSGSALSPGDVRGFYEGTSLLPPVFFYLEIICFLLSLLILLLCTPAYVFCVASLYSTGGDLRAAGSVLNGRLPVNPLIRIAFTFHLMAVSFLVASLSVAGLVRLEDDIMLLLLRLLVRTSAVFAAVVCQLSGVASVLEVAVLFGAVRRSRRELVATKFWAVETMLLALAGCVIALLVAFPALLVDVARGLGLGLQLAAGAVMAVQLWALLLFILVGERVVYNVCKRHRREVIDGGEN